MSVVLLKNLEYVKFKSSVQILSGVRSIIDETSVIDETTNSGPGSFAIQFGDHFGAGDYLRACSVVPKFKYMLKVDSPITYTVYQYP